MRVISFIICILLNIYTLSYIIVIIVKYIEMYDYRVPFLIHSIRVSCIGATPGGQQQSNRELNAQYGPGPSLRPQSKNPAILLSE